MPLSCRLDGISTPHEKHCLPFHSPICIRGGFNKPRFKIERRQIFWHATTCSDPAGNIYNLLYCISIFHIGDSPILVPFSFSLPLPTRPLIGESSKKRGARSHDYANKRRKLCSETGHLAHLLYSHPCHKSARD